MKEKISNGWKKIKNGVSNHKKAVITTVAVIGTSLVAGGALAKKFHGGDFELDTEEEEIIDVEGTPIEEITELTVKSDD